ncbi:MAG TPA: J domain-containing protein [Candidatus Binatia bacterium]|nr:J domain-containing protein [Candidatus Binatia bacterium]
MNPFAVLGLEETADDEAVRAAYLAALRLSPPDRDPERFRRIRDAYEALRDKEHRLALRLFGPPPLADLMELLDAFPTERRYVGPGPWLNVLREHRR